MTNEVIKNELLILQTLGFDVQIRHPHPDVVKCTQLVRGNFLNPKHAYCYSSSILKIFILHLYYIVRWCKYLRIFNVRFICILLM